MNRKTMIYALLIAALGACNARLTQGYWPPLWCVAMTITVTAVIIASAQVTAKNYQRGR